MNNNMMVSVLAFGIAKEIVGESAAKMEFDEGMAAKDLKARLEQQFPGLKDLKSFMIAVNGEYALPDTVINADDEIAIIPPVSGG